MASTNLVLSLSRTMNTAGVHASVAEGVFCSRAVIKGKMPISFTTPSPFAIFEPVLMHALQSMSPWRLTCIVANYVTMLLERLWTLRQTMAKIYRVGFVTMYVSYSSILL